VHAFAVAASLVVGGVFVVSSVAKLADPARWRSQSADMGVPWSAARVVPYGEAVLAAWLIVQWQRAAAASVAVLVLVAFTALVAVRLAQGRHPVCACFGSLSARPIGASTLVRNGLIVAVALVAAVG
jgi:hypothetical protein